MRNTLIGKKPTSSPEFEINKTNFRTFGKIVNRQIMKQKSITSWESFGEIKMIKKKLESN